MDDKSQILSLRKNLLKFSAFIITPVVISIILANLVLKNPSHQDTRFLIEAAYKTNNDEKVVELLSLKSDTREIFLYPRMIRIRFLLKLFPDQTGAG